MITIQLFGLIIGLGALHISYLYYKRMYFTKKEVLFWVALWGAFMVVALFPRILSPVVGYLGLTRSMDLIMIIGFVILFVLAFHNYIVTNRLERRLERLIRELTLKDL